MSNTPIKPGDVITAEFLNNRLGGDSMSNRGRVLGGPGNLAGATTSGVAVGQAGRGGRENPIRLRVKTINDDYLECVTWNGTTEGQTLNVAKPYELRHVVGNYPQLTSITTTDEQTVEATDGTTTETWKVTPDYTEDGEIEAALVNGTGVSVDGYDLKFIDMNNAGRGWGVEE